MDLQEFIEEWNNGRDYVVAHTSGSTGKPKEIRLLKSDMLASARATNAFFGINHDSILAIPLSMDYIAGKMMAVRTIAANCKLECIKPSNTFELPLTADLLAIVPTQVPWLLSHQEKAKDYKNVIIGGAPLPLKEQGLLHQSGFKAFCTYGMTETCSHVALQKITGNIEPFKGLPNVHFETDERSCLVIYAENLSCEKIVTNDIVELNDQHSFYWKGRYDNVINSGGIKIHPEEVEAILATCIPVPFYIRKGQDEKWGECAELVIEGEKDNFTFLEMRIPELLEKYKIPKKICFVNRIERTYNGKIKRT